MKKNIAAAIILSFVVLASATGCRTGVFVQQCQGAACAGVTIGFDQELFSSLESFNAYLLYETREVDPGVYTHDSSFTPTGTITVVLLNGSQVSYSGALRLDTATYVPPRTPGFNTLVYRPSNPAALQTFIDQYKDQTASVEVDTLVKLRDISGGSVPFTHVDAQGSYTGGTQYLGSASGSPPSFTPLNQDI